MTTTWRKEIQQARKSNDDLEGEFVCTLTEAELDEEFDDGYGGTNGKAFVAWGQKYVYFPICYDGAEWAGSAPRNPPHEPLEHQGGG